MVALRKQTEGPIQIDLPDQTEIPIKIDYSRSSNIIDFNNAIALQQSISTREGIVTNSFGTPYSIGLGIAAAPTEVIYDDVTEANSQQSIKEAIKMHRKAMLGFFAFGSIGLVSLTSFFVLGFVGAISSFVLTIGLLMSISFVTGVIIDFLKWDRRHA